MYTLSGWNYGGYTLDTKKLVATLFVDDETTLTEKVEKSWDNYIIKGFVYSQTRHENTDTVDFIWMQ